MQNRNIAPRRDKRVRAVSESELVPASRSSNESGQSPLDGRNPHHLRRTMLFCSGATSQVCRRACTGTVRLRRRGPSPSPGYRVAGWRRRRGLDPRLPLPECGHFIKDCLDLAVPSISAKEAARSSMREILSAVPTVRSASLRHRKCQKSNRCDVSDGQAQTAECNLP